MQGLADYELLDALGRGSDGRCFLARAPDRLGIPDERCVVKLLDRDATDQEFRRVAAELRVVEAVASERVVSLFEVGHHRGALWSTMAFHEAGSLADVPTDVTGRALALVADAARGAHALHEVGIVHRAIKPTNVLLTADGRAALAHPGMAQLISPGLTSTGMGSIGSIEFMEPDLIWGEPAARASDIWSLGLTLHRVVTGRGPYGDIPSGHMAEAFRHVLHTQPALDADLAAPLRRIIERCTAPDRKERYGTALDVAEELVAVGDAP